MCFLWCISCGVSICISGMGKNGVQRKADDTSSCYCYQQLFEGGALCLLFKSSLRADPCHRQLKLPLPLRSCSHVLENGPVDGVEPVLLLDLGVGSMRKQALKCRRVGRLDLMDFQFLAAVLYFPPFTCRNLWGSLPLLISSLSFLQPLPPSQPDPFLSMETW